MDIFQSPNFFVETLTVMLVFVGLSLMPFLRYGCAYHSFVKTGRKVGPTYWGQYVGAKATDDACLRTIEMKKPTKTGDGMAGSRSYGNG